MSLDMPGKTLSYRRISPDVVTLRAALNRSEAWLLFSSLGCLLVAALVMLFPAAMVNGIVHAILLKFGIMLPFSNWLWILLIFAIVTPLLFWYERRTHGDFFLDAMRGQGQSASDRPASYGEWEMKRTGATLAMYVEIALWGPRVWRESVAKLQYRRKLGPADFTRLCAIIESLLEVEDGVQVSDLLSDGESIEVLRKNLFHLRILDWIDLSKDGRRVWMLSDRRTNLIRAA